MKGDRTRVARRLLLALLVVVSGAVAWSLRRPPSRTPGGETATPPDPAQGTTVEEGSLVRFTEGKQKIAVKWRTMSGREGDATRLEGVEVTVPFVRQGREASAVITADSCLYDAAAQRAAFRGNVRVRTDDGLELETEALKYWGDEGLAFTKEDVRFRRGSLSGTARGLDYQGEKGLSLHHQVHIVLPEEGGEPAEIESANAWASREQRLVRFEGGVVARQGDRVLRSARLQLHLDAELSAVERATATEDVEVRSRGGLPGTDASGGAEKRLRCRQLDVAYRSKGLLREVLAVGAASLEIDPGPHDPPERRRVAAPRLRFDFDEEGRLASLSGLPAGQAEPGGPGLAVLTAEPRGRSGAGVRRVESRTFSSALDPATGAVRGARFEGSVVFTEPGRRAWAERADYEEAAGLVTLAGNPRVVDEADKSELRGRRIQIWTRTGDVAASGSVRHTMGRREGTGRPGVLGREEPAVIVCGEFEYDAASRQARYRENALLRAGRDEIRAPALVLEEPAPGRRRLTATGGTRSRLHPRPAEGATKEPEPVESTSREMVYEESEGRIVYTGEVEIRQGDILTLSPEAVVTLTRDGGAVERLMAGEPVEVRQGRRRARGERGTYTPSSETLVLVGERVVLEDVDRRLEGRILTFEVGGDRIRVDGREEVRTEAVFKHKEPPRR